LRESNRLAACNEGDFSTVVDTIVFVENNPNFVFNNIQREMISRATNGFCYTNVVSTNNRFRQDILTSKLWGSDADIIQRWDERQSVYGRNDPYLEHYFPEMSDTVFLSREHLSLWPFHDRIEFKFSTAIKMYRVVVEFALEAPDNPHKRGKSDEYKRTRGNISDFYNNKTDSSNKLPRKSLMSQKLAQCNVELWQIEDCFK
jgi:hypothetical protein